MTAAQKKVAANFKKALAIRKATGCSLKDAFAKVYGKKTAVKKVAKKTIGSSNIPKASANLGKRLYDEATNISHFTDEVSELIGVSRDMGFTLPQTKTAIKYILDGIYNYYEDEF